MSKKSKKNRRMVNGVVRNSDKTPSSNTATAPRRIPYTTSVGKTKLFAYGTLNVHDVQRSIWGEAMQGQVAILRNFELKQWSGSSIFYLERKPGEVVSGKVYELTEELTKTPLSILTSSYYSHSYEYGGYSKGYQPTIWSGIKDKLDEEADEIYKSYVKDEAQTFLYDNNYIQEDAIEDAEIELFNIKQEANRLANTIDDDEDLLGHTIEEDIARYCELEDRAALLTECIKLLRGDKYGTRQIGFRTNTGGVKA